MEGLEVVHLRKAFGGVQVINDLDLVLGAGDAVGVVGPNGAGKTTLVNLITGAVGVDSGRILLNGKDITGLPPHVRCRLGIARTHQIPLPFEDMTVFENVLVAAVYGRGEPERAGRGYAEEAMERAHIVGRANHVAGSLTLLERKRLELARALATGPEILLLDEIAGGLAETEIESLVADILELRAAGVTILWIEHIVDALLKVVDRMVVIDFGCKLMEGDPEVVMNSPEVHDIYLGVDTHGTA